MTKTITGPALAGAILTAIDKESERFNMSAWAARTDPSCGTTLCVAGWAVELNGGRFVFDSERQTSTHLVRRPDGKVVNIADWAADLLGLDEGHEDEDEVDVFGLGDEEAKEWLVEYAARSA